MSTLIDFADRLRAQIDIVTVVEAYVQLRHAGNNLKGVCPFHKEKTPSFSVNQAKQIFHCFGCGEGGDIIKFIQKIERLEWVEAVRFLAERYHIEMPEYRGKSSRPGERDERRRLIDINGAAQAHFARRLEEACRNPGSEVSRYLERRQLDLETVRRFGLGLSVDGWSDFLDAGRKAGFERDALVGAGLVIHNQQSNRHYDRFRKRLMFPVCDSQGRPIAFGGRVYASDAAPDEPKYVNSPETAVYQKGQQLYALHLAKDAIVREKHALVMEGYMDVIRAHQHGFGNAVATCGTALTEEQARALRKFCRTIVFVYDGDAAGQKAMLRGCEVLVEEEFAIKVVVLPGDHDPDSFLCECGADAFRQHIAGARDFFRFFCEAAAARFDRATPEGKVQIVEFLMPILRRVRNPILARDYVHQAAEYLGIEDGLIMRQLRDSNPRSIEKLREAVEETSIEISAVEKVLLRAAVESSRMRARLADGFDTGWIRHPLLRRWIAHCQQAGPHEDISWDDMLACCRSEEEARLMRGIALDETEPWDDSDQAINHCFARLEFHHRRQAASLIARQIGESCSANPESDTNPMMQKLQDITPATGVGRHFFRRD